METNKKTQTEVDVRGSFGFSSSNLFARIVQFIMTWITGKPDDGEQPLFKRSNLSHLFTAYITLLVGVGSCLLVIFLNAFYLLLPIGFLMVVSGARKLATTINHYCVHGDFINQKWKDKKWFNLVQYALAEFNSLLVFLQPYEVYRQEHVGEHHKPSIVATLKDPDMQFLWSLGFRPGMSKQDLWKNYWLTLVSPSFHFIFLKARLSANMTKGPTWRKVAFILYVCLLLILMTVNCPAVVIAWLLPLTFFYHISALTQFLSEHYWTYDHDGQGMVDHLNMKDQIARGRKITNARFFGEKAPGNRSLLDWTYWVMKMLLVHIPLRYYVVPGDLPQHDWHHRCNKFDDWANAPYTRMRCVKELNKGAEPYSEVWGLSNALDLVFDNFSKLPAIQLEVEVEVTDPLLGM